MNLNYTFDLLNVTRKNIISLAEQFDEEKLNTIPTGFRNNLIWNMGHVVVTQHLLCYGLSGNKGYVTPEMVNRYRKGTAPESKIDGNEIQNIFDLLATSTDQLKADYDNGLFQKYTPYETSYGIGFDKIEQAIQFDVAHEAMHLGTMLGIRKFL